MKLPKMEVLKPSKLNFVFEPRKVEMNQILESQGFRDYCAEIFRQSQVNGINQIASAKTVFRKILKTIVFLFCLTGFLYQAITFFNHFQEHPSVLTVDLQFADSLDFPAISVCHNTRLKRSLVCPRDEDFCANNLQCDGIIEDRVIRDYVTSHCPRYILNVSPDYKNLMKCRTQGLASDNEPLGHICDHIERVYSADYPSCFSFNARWNHPNISGIRAREGQKLILDLSFEANQSTEWDREIGGRLIIGSNFDLPFGEEGSVIRPGFKYKVTFKQQTKISLPAPYPTNCTDYDQQRIEYDGVKPLTWKMCVHECVLNLSIKLCQCVHSSMPVTEYGKYPYCLTNNVEKMNCLEHRIPKAKRTCELRCKQECLVRIYDVTILEQSYPPNKLMAWNESYWKNWKFVSFSILQNYFTYLFVRFPVVYFYRKEHASVEFLFESREHLIFNYQPKYESVELFSFIGGYIGIWLGISLVAFCDFVENVVLLCRYGFRKKVRGKLQEKLGAFLRRTYQSLTNKRS